MISMELLTQGAYVLCAILSILALLLFLDILKSLPQIMVIPYLWLLLVTGIALVISTVVLKVHMILFGKRLIAYHIENVYFFLGNLFILFVLVKLWRGVSE